MVTAPLGVLFTSVLSTIAPLPPSSQPSQIEPRFARPASIVEQGPSPEYYRTDPNLFALVLRTQLGAHVRVAPSAGVAFSIDALAGLSMRVGRVSPLRALACVGYHYVGFGSHFFVLQTGALLDIVEEPQSRKIVSVGLTVDGLAGAQESIGALGVRTSLLLSVYGLTVSAGHQWTRSPSGDVHEAHFMLGTLISLGGSR